MTSEHRGQAESLHHIPVSLLDDIRAFNRYFAVTEADTPDLLHQAHRLRYQVYCVENQFEHASESDQIEIDSTTPTLRTQSSLTAQRGRVMDNVGRSSLSRYADFGIAEVSRYAVAKHFRRRVGETHFPDVNFSELGTNNQRRIMPHLTLGLMLAIARLSVRYGVTHLCAVMAPALLRLLSKFGMDFEILGPAIEYHGIRQPCIGACADLLAGVKQRHPGYFDLLNPEFSTATLIDGLN